MDIITVVVLVTTRFVVSSSSSSSSSSCLRCWCRFATFHSLFLEHHILARPILLTSSSSTSLITRFNPSAGIHSFAYQYYFCIIVRLYASGYRRRLLIMKISSFAFTASTVFNAFFVVVSANSLHERRYAHHEALHGRRIHSSSASAAQPSSSCSLSSSCSTYVTTILQPKITNMAAASASK